MDLETGPEFSFDVPEAHDWFLVRGVIGFNSFGPWQPWYYYPRSEAFDVIDKWPDGPYEGPGTLVVFARRQDCDDCACFEVVDGHVNKIHLIHGWTPSGYSIDETYDNFWNWLKSTVDDIRELMTS